MVRDRDVPGPGQESVWDYPRPPRVEESPRRVRVSVGGVTIVDTCHAKRVLETSSPPVFYVPVGEVAMEHLRLASGTTFCEWKGTAAYFDIAVGDRTARRAAWSYAEPSPGYEAIGGHIAFYPGRVDECFLDDEPVRPQPGDYYGGWVTDDIVGPFKGERGTEGW